MNTCTGGNNNGGGNNIFSGGNTINGETTSAGGNHLKFTHYSTHTLVCTLDLHSSMQD